MPTVITAILLDPEARANDQGGNDQPTDGHLQEPALLIPAVVRAFAGQMTPANWYPSTLASMGQDVFNAPSVFNYYSPGFMVGGTGGLLRAGISDRQSERRGVAGELCRESHQFVFESGTKLRPGNHGRSVRRFSR